MHWLNYHHLLYFWTVVREGSLVAAGRALRLSHATLSTQIKSLEEQLGEKLLVKSGRRLVTTEAGRAAFSYASEIFSLGHEMVDVVRGASAQRAPRLEVGIVDVLPKQIARRLLAPALADDGSGVSVRITCREGPIERLLADLALHTIDIVLSDSPVPSGSPIRAYHHLLGESPISFFAVPSLVAKLRRGFPGSLDGAPMLLPLEDLTLRRSLNDWFAKKRIRPKVMGEFEDSALLKALGADGHGVFPAPTVVAREVAAQYGVKLLGRCDVRERYYAITGERRLRNPAVMAISESARSGLLKATRVELTVEPRGRASSAKARRARA